MAKRNPEDYFTRSEVAAKLGLNVSTLKNWERARRGPRVVRVSERVALYPKIDLESYLLVRSTGSPPL